MECGATVRDYDSGHSILFDCTLSLVLRGFGRWTVLVGLKFCWHTIMHVLLEIFRIPLKSSLSYTVSMSQIQYKIAVLTYKVLHDTAPWYLGPLDRVADLHGRRALRSASASRLVVPMFRLSKVGSRTFNVSGPRIWNGLPEDVSAPTFSSFRHRLKPFLFQQS